MTVPSDRGFHPQKHIVARLSKTAPHRQILLLLAISVFTVASMVAAVVASLVPASDSLTASTDTLIPAITPIDIAQRDFNDASRAFVLANNADPEIRNAGIAQLAAAKASASAAWNKYRAVAVGLPGERAFQRSFVVHRKVVQVLGLTLVTGGPAAGSLASASEALNAVQLDLNSIKALYDAKVHQTLRRADERVEATSRQIVGIAVGALIILLASFGIALHSARTREVRLATLDHALATEAERNELESRLQRSFEMAHTEPAAFELVARALSLTAPGTPAELLVADSSRAHFYQAISTDEHGGPACPVMSPADCPAATWGGTQVWPSSTDLDACPHLKGRPEGECSAVCVPLSISGKIVSVVHATAPDHHPPDQQVVAKIELISRKVGERVGMLRAFMRSETQANTDPLTGLINRRSLEQQVRELSEQGHTYVAAYGDLDYFKQLNDVYGHDAGDQALRLFARVLRDTVRPDDLTARYGGEEFVVVLPDCSVSDAYAVINRLRETLAKAQSSRSVAPFTVSFGITAASPENTFGQTLEIADAALLKAKATGRDRIVISGYDKADTESLPAETADAQPQLSI